jgi:hypothetical protein
VINLVDAQLFGLFWEKGDWTVAIG